MRAAGESVRGQVAALLVLLLAAAWSAGCLRNAAPTPRAEDKRVRRVVPGVTTRAEVQTALGKPNVVQDGDVWIYEWQTNDATITFGTGSMYDPGLSTGNPHSFFALVQFDESGRVARYEVQSDPVGLAGRLGAASPAPLAYLPRLQELERSGCGDSRCIPTLLSSDGRWAVGPRGDRLALWRVGAEAAPLDLGAPDGRVGLVALSAGAERVAYPAGGGVVVVDVESGEVIARVEARRIDALALNAAGSRLAVATGSGELILWDIDRDVVVSRVPLSSDVVSIDYSPTDPIVALVDRDDTLQWIAEDGGRVLRRLPRRSGKRWTRTVRFSADGRWLAGAGEVHAEIWAVEAVVSGRASPSRVLLLPVTGNSLDVPHRLFRPRAVFSDDGSRLAVISPRHVSLWDWREPLLLAVLDETTGRGLFNKTRPLVYDVAFDDAGRLLTSGAGAIDEWDPSPLEDLPRLQGQRY